MTALAEVLERAEARRAGLLLAGATALAGHGIARATRDIDLLGTDLALLQPEFWRGVRGVDLRIGEPGDPLDGVVRVVRSRQRPVDVFVLSRPWTRGMHARARDRLTIGDAVVCVPEAADLVLLKLYAGRPQDLADVRSLLAVAGPDVVAAVDGRVSDLPEDAVAVWASVRPR